MGVNKNSQGKNLKIIEDSVDSIILSKNNMFINKSEFEILAVHKIIGSIGGGVVITKNSNFYKHAKKEQMQNKILVNINLNVNLRSIIKEHLILGFTMKV